MQAPAISPAPQKRIIQNMPEVTYRLPGEVFLEADKFTPIELGRLSIAGFVDFEEYERTDNHDRWPYPLFLLDGEESWERVESMNGEVRRYWRLIGNVVTNKVNELTIVSVPADGSSPWVYYGSANWPVSGHVYLFEPPLPYSQDQLIESVTQTELTYPGSTPGP